MSKPVLISWPVWNAINDPKHGAHRESLTKLARLVHDDADREFFVDTGSEHRPISREEVSRIASPRVMADVLLEIAWEEAQELRERARELAEKKAAKKRALREKEIRKRWEASQPPPPDPVKEAQKKREQFRYWEESHQRSYARSRVFLLEQIRLEREALTRRVTMRRNVGISQKLSWVDYQSEVQRYEGW
jgi:hypothetical protein